MIQSILGDMEADTELVSGIIHRPVKDPRSAYLVYVHLGIAGFLA